MSANPPSLTELLRASFDAGVHAVDATTATHRALERGGAAPGPRGAALIVTGKAASGMARALVEWLEAGGAAPSAGIIVAATPVEAPHPALRTAVGDHPIPGPGSVAAAAAIGDVVAALPADIDVQVAISGGSSSLIAGPVDGLGAGDMIATFRLLLTSGLDIDAMNAVRKRLTRWSAGRLAAALAPRRVRAWLLSDVQGDDPATIGSGPCSPDAWTTARVHDELRRTGLLSQLPAAVLPLLDAETLKAGDAVFRNVTVDVVADNATARDAAAREAQRRGAVVHVVTRYLDGEAAVEGRRIAELVRGAAPSDRLEVWVMGGETTVTITGNAGKGGRAQELALAAAEAWAGDGTGDEVALLAAGTDGRDGPTDAAGALVTGTTWQRIGSAGVDARRALAAHDTYRALDAAGALLRTGPTGTNVTDLVIAARRARGA